MIGSSPTSTSATPTWGRDPAGAVPQARGPSGTGAESLSPQPNADSYVLLEVNEARSESEDHTQTRTHKSRAHRVAQDQEPPARTLIGTRAALPASQLSEAPADLLTSLDSISYGDGLEPFVRLADFDEAVPWLVVEDDGGFA